jgi:hypothetical protein
MLNVVCVKHGNKYTADHVNKLYNMIQRHLTMPYHFYCFTEDAQGLNSNIHVIHLGPHPVISGWWWKPYVFKNGHFPAGDTILFFDLDMVIVNNIDKLVTYQPGKFIGLEDVGRVFRKHPAKLGSAVMRWPSGQYFDLWDDLEKDLTIVKKFRGDQDWIWKKHQETIEFFPEKWIMSYKWEVRSRSELDLTNRLHLFKTIGTPTIDPETSVLAFHGRPKLEDVKDSVIVDNWR